MYPHTTISLVNFNYTFVCVRVCVWVCVCVVRVKVIQEMTGSFEDITALYKFSHSELRHSTLRLTFLLKFASSHFSLPCSLVSSGCIGVT